MRLFIATLIIGLTLFSCDKDNGAVSPDDLIGNWSSDHITVARPGGEVLLDTIYNVHHLGIEEDRSFYYTYWTGSWELDGRTLRLIHNPDITDATWTYELISVTEEKLVMRSTGRPERCKCTLPGVEPDAVVVITETFLASGQ